MRKLILTTTIAASFALSAAAVEAADYTPLPEMSPVFDWTGPYIGGHVGAAWLRTGGDQGPKPGISEIQKNSAGVMGGAQAGYNFQIAPSWILGVEGDFSLTDLDKTVPCNDPTYTCNAGSDWTASVRGRVGYAIDRILLFATGGVAFLDYNGNTSTGAVTFKDSKTMTGWTVGGGVEWAWTENVILRGEYRYADFGKATMAYDVPYHVRPKEHIARFGVSFKF